MLFLVNLLAICLMVCCIVILFKTEYYCVLPVLYLCLVKIWDSVSVAFLERGVFSPELHLTTGPTGGTIRYVFAILAMLMGIALAFRVFLSKAWLARATAASESKQESSEHMYSILCWFAIAAGVALIVVRPEGDLLSKATFGAEEPSLLRDLLLKYLPFAALALGVATGRTTSVRTRNIGFSGLVLILAVLVSYGNKFSSLALIASFFATPYLAYLRFRPMDRKVFGLSGTGLLVAGAGLMILVISLGLLLYLHGSDVDVLEYLGTRIFLLQGGIWWHTDWQANFGHYRPGLVAFLEFMQSVNYHKNSSLMYLMSQAIGHDLTYKVFFVSFSLYTGAFPSIFYVLGLTFSGVFVGCGLVGFVLGVVSAYVMRKILRGEILLTLLGFSIFLPIFMVLDAGEFVQLFSLALVAKIGLVILAELTLMTLRHSEAAGQATAGA